MLYYTLIHPYIVYCNTVWGYAKISILKKIAVLQKRAVRLCTGASYLSPSNPLFVRLNLLKLSDVHNMQIAIFMYKIKYCQLPRSFSHYATVSNVLRHHDTRPVSYFIQLRSRTDIHGHSISVHGPRLWDSLPISIQQSTGIGALKSSLWAHYISSYSS